MTKGSASVSLPARAKLNLRLNVLGLQPNGLHGVRSLIGDLELADDIEILESFGPFGVECEGASIPERENLAWLAAQRLDVDLFGCRIRIRKHIPIQAGLGGGSADAAAALRGLVDFLGKRGLLVPPERVRHAALVGSDVPACLVTGFKIVEGHGDIVRRLSIAAPPWGVLLLRPTMGVPTAEAYRLLDAARGKDAPPAPEGEIAELSKALELGNFARACNLLQNDFQSVVELVFPNVAQARERLSATGAAATLLCGSGSCVAGFFETREAARAASKKLKLTDGEWMVATGFART